MSVQKAMEAARRNMIKVQLKNGTIHHNGGRRPRRRPGPDGAGSKPGTGIIAGGPMRAVFEVMGVTDIVGQEPRLDEPLQHGARHADA